MRLTIDSKVQFFAYQRVRDAVNENRAKAGSVVVLDAQTGGVLALANYPSYVPGTRRHGTASSCATRADRHRRARLDDEALHRRAGAGVGRVRPTEVIQTPRQLFITARRSPTSCTLPMMTAEQIIQRSSNVGTAKMAMRCRRARCGDFYTRVGFGQKPQIDFPAASPAGCAAGSRGGRSTRPPSASATACRCR